MTSAVTFQVFNTLQLSFSVYGANRPWGGLTMGQIVHGRIALRFERNVHGAKRTVGEKSGNHVRPREMTCCDAYWVHVLWQ